MVDVRRLSAMFFSVYPIWLQMNKRWESSKQKNLLLKGTKDLSLPSKPTPDFVVIIFLVPRTSAL